MFGNSYAHYFSISSYKTIPGASSALLKHRSIRKLKIALIYDSMYSMYAPLFASRGTAFQVRHRVDQTRSGFTIFISYCHDIQEAEDVSTDTRGNAIRPPHVRWLTTMDAARNQHFDRPGTLPEMIIPGNSVSSRTTQTARHYLSHLFCTARLAESDAEQSVQSASLSPWPFHLDQDDFRKTPSGPDKHSSLSFKLF